MSSAFEVSEDTLGGGHMHRSRVGHVFGELAGDEGEIGTSERRQVL